VKRRRLITLVSICTLLALGLATAAAVVVVMRTDIARRFVENRLASAVNGTVHVGRIRGNPFSGVTVDTLAIRDVTGELFLSTGHVAVDYDVRDLLAMRLFLRHLAASHPYVHVRQFANGEWNHQRIFKGSPSTGRKPIAPRRSWGDYVVLDSVRALDATFILSLSWTPDDTLHGSVRDSVINQELARTDRNLRKTGDGYARNYVWTHQTAVLPHLRLADPDSNKFGQEFVIASLDADESDPPFRWRNVRGLVKHLGDSVWLNLSHWDLPASSGSASGKIVWGGPLPIRYDLAVRGDSVSLKDVNWVYPTLPKTGGGRLQLLISNKRDVHVMDYKLAKLDIRSTGTHLTGEMTFGVGAPVLQVWDVNVTASPLDFEFIKTLNGKPFPVDWAGQLYGSMEASGGPLTHFQVNSVSAEFRDSHIRGSVSKFSGRGGLDILNPVYTAFQDFQLNVQTLDFRTIQYLYPGFPRLGGTVAGRVTLDSLWTDVRFRAAAITLHDGPGRPSRLTGRGRITDGTPFIKFDVSLVADSLSFETLARSYPALKLRGMASGPINVRGSSPNLEVVSRLAGPWGQLSYDGRLDIDSVGGYSAYGRGEFSSVNLARALTNPKAPFTILNGRYDLAVAGASAGTLSGSAVLKLDRSRLDSAMFTASNAAVKFTNGQAILTDTVHVEGPMGRLTAYGSIGLPGGAAVDSIHVTLAVDSVGLFRPYLASARGASKPDSLEGTLLVTGVAVGSLDSLLVTGTIAGENLYVRGIDAARMTGAFSIFDALRAPYGEVHVIANGLLAGGLEFDTVRAQLTIADTSHGSYVVNGVGSTIPNLSLGAGGNWLVTGTTTALRLDSMSLTMADSRWGLEQPATLTIGSNVFRIDSLAIQNGHGGSFAAAGTVPDSAAVDLRLTATHFPLVDLDRMVSRSTSRIAGFGDLSARFAGTKLDLQVDASVTLDSITIGDVRIGKLLSTAHYQNQRATVGLNISQGGKPVLEASADSLPLSVSLFTYDTMPGRVHATFTADSADLALVEAFFEGVSEVKGKLSGQMTFDGSWSRPEIAGRFALHNGSLRVDTLGIALDSLSGTATFARDTLTIGRMRARSGDTENSVANLLGRIAFEKWKPSWFDLSLDLQDFEVYNRPELARVVATTDSGSVRLFGTPAADSLTGYIAVDRGNIFLPDRKTAAKQIREQNVVPPDTLTSEGRVAADSTFFQRISRNLSTDLRIHVGNDVSLSADYAEIPLTGDLRIKPITVYSTTAARGGGAYISRLAPEGTIFADRGNYTLDFVVVRRDLRVDKGGTITFDRNADWNPYLNLTTRYNVKSYGHPDIPVIVDVKGRLMPSPQLSFRSDAPFPISESDLVSYLLTGQPGFDLAGQSAEYKSLVASVLAPTVSSALSSTLRGRLGNGFDLRVEGATADIAGKSGTQAFAQSVQQFLYSTRINGEMQVSDNLFFRLSAGLCQLNNNYRTSLAQGSVLNQLSDPFGGNLEYRLSSTVRTGSNVQFAIEPSTQALLCSPSSELSLRGAAPTPRQYSLSFLKYWRW